MRKFIIIAIFFFCQTTFCQEYHFDYFCEYDYTLNKSETTKHKCITLANTKDKNIVISIDFENDKIKSARMNDFKNEKVYPLTDFSIDSLNKINIKILNSNHFNMTDCQKKNNFYEINKIGDSINIKRFKNQKKRKLINESNYLLKKIEGFEGQIYSFPPLIYPLRCGKFVLNTDEVIVESIYLIDDKESYHYKLVKIKKIKFDFNLTNN